MALSVVRPMYRDPLTPTLLSSPAVVLSDEQKIYIRAVLDIVSSDSRFAEKGYLALIKILTGGSVPVPSITSLTPNTAVIGDPSFTLHVRGTKFVLGSIIVFAGQDEPTTHVSDTELTTGVDMSVWLGPDTLPVLVRSPDGVLSAPVMFTFLPAVSLAASKSLPIKDVVVPTKEPVKQPEPMKKDEKK